MTQARQWDDYEASLLDEIAHLKEEVQGWKRLYRESQSENERLMQADADNAQKADGDG